MLCRRAPAIRKEKGDAVAGQHGKCHALLPQVPLNDPQLREQQGPGRQLCLDRGDSTAPKDRAMGTVHVHTVTQGRAHACEAHRGQLCSRAAVQPCSRLSSPFLGVGVKYLTVKLLYYFIWYQKDIRAEQYQKACSVLHTVQKKTNRTARLVARFSTVCSTPRLVARFSEVAGKLCKRCLCAEPKS